MMMVPPPWAISRSRRSAGAAGVWEGAGIGPGVTSGAAGLGYAGVCIGRKVMVVVVFRVFRMLCAAAGGGHQKYDGHGRDNRVNCVLHSLYDL